MENPIACVKSCLPINAKTIVAIPASITKIEKAQLFALFAIRILRSSVSATSCCLILSSLQVIMR